MYTALRNSTNGVSTSNGMPAHSLILESHTITLVCGLVGHISEDRSTHIVTPEEFDDAIKAWKESIALEPSSPDAHTSQSSITNV